MVATSELADKTNGSFATALRRSAVVWILLFAAFLKALGVSLLPLVLVAGVAGLLVLALRHPTTGVGLLLAFMPVYTMVFLLAKFLGPPYVGSLEGCDRALLLPLVFILWWRNGIKLTTPDWFLLICFGLAALRLAISGTFIGLLTDFSFMIAYAAGRVTVLTPEQEKRWARRAVWIVAVVSVLGMTEVFGFGEGPRTILYLAVANGGTDGGALDAAFHAGGYSGLRESATMFGPLQFAPLCMTALIVWWVYRRNLLPALMIAAGLICSVTRSAWVGTILAFSVLAIVTRQTKRLLLYSGLALALFVASIPVLGLGDYIFSTKTGQDPSEQGHQESILSGLEYVSAHPFGVGPGNAGKYAVKSYSSGVGIENSYLIFAAQYGIVTSLCFIGFLATGLRVAWRKRTQVAYVAVGVIVGFGSVMMFAALHDVFPLACWLWFPVGLVVRSSLKAECAIDALLTKA
jgi:hypothetical protein